MIWTFTKILNPLRQTSPTVCTNCILGWESSGNGGALQAEITDWTFGQVMEEKMHPHIFDLTVKLMLLYFPLFMDHSAEINRKSGNWPVFSQWALVCWGSTLFVKLRAVQVMWCIWNYFAFVVMYNYNSVLCFKM